MFYLYRPIKNSESLLEVFWNYPGVSWNIHVIMNWFHFLLWKSHFLVQPWSTTWILLKLLPGSPMIHQDPPLESTRIRHWDPPRSTTWITQEPSEFTRSQHMDPVGSTFLSHQDPSTRIHQHPPLLVSSRIHQNLPPWESTIIHHVNLPGSTMWIRGI